MLIMVNSRCAIPKPPARYHIFRYRDVIKGVQNEAPCARDLRHACNILIADDCEPSCTKLPTDFVDNRMLAASPAIAGDRYLRRLDPLDRAQSPKAGG